MKSRFTFPFRQAVGVNPEFPSSLRILIWSCIAHVSTLYVVATGSEKITSVAEAGVTALSRRGRDVAVFAARFSSHWVFVKPVLAIGFVIECDKFICSYLVPSWECHVWKFGHSFNKKITSLKQCYVPRTRAFDTADSSMSLNESSYSFL